jgi:5-methyltetrahydrofolate--homocysteine methyltransferase
VASLPRRPPQIEQRLRLSGLEPLNIGPDSLFLNVGERTTSQARPVPPIDWADGYNAALDVARQQVTSGAGDRHQHGLRACRFEAAMVRFLNLIAASRISRACRS